jgi:starch synthase (maltosyl-transferring)
MTSAEPTDAAIEQALKAPRIAVSSVAPLVECGQFPAKHLLGQPLAVAADIFVDGHAQLAATLLWNRPATWDWVPLPMHPLGNDRWEAILTPQVPGRHRFAIEAWIDEWETFRHDLSAKNAAGAATAVDMRDGIQLLERAHDTRRAEAPRIADLLRRLETAPPEECTAILLADDTAELVARLQPRPFLTRFASIFRLEVERTAAAFGSWYELFPRSQSNVPGRQGTFDDVIARLPAIKSMGFDVLYMPPIHPIGYSKRKGRNNNPQAGPGDVGSPYAIGNADGGHDAVAAELGGLDGFRRLQTAASQAGIELALDFAIQCSPDHPWLEQHPGWFSRRSDGSFRCAENPPKKYEDIINVDFYGADEPRDLWLALRDVLRFWIAEGINIFRVDNPHTKPLPFWEWIISSIRRDHPQVIFLAEAFTRPAMMARLAQVGFSQSYTYFIWRNSRSELADYMTELTAGPAKDFFRPHFFVNTPDINPYFLQTSGRPGFLIRAALAATLSGLWGIYSGFELCEAEPLPGREEYLDSEKYELRARDWNAPGNIVNEISRLNLIRRSNPALHSHLGLSFLEVGNDRILYFAKATTDRSNVLVIAISLDPHAPQQAILQIPFHLVGAADDAALEVEELMRGARFAWKGNRQHWYFDPLELPFAIWRLPAAGASWTH